MSAKYIVYRERLYRRADQDIPSTDTLRMERTKARQPDPKKRVPDPTTGDQAGEFISWLKALLDLPVSAERTAAGDTGAAETPAATPDAASKAAEDKLAKEKEAIALIEKRIKELGKGDTQKAVQTILNYLRSYARNPSLDEQAGKDKFSEFISGLRVVNTLNIVINKMMTDAKNLKA